jgi:hypothetical protein
VNKTKFIVYSVFLSLLSASAFADNCDLIATATTMSHVMLPISLFIFAVGVAMQIPQLALGALWVGLMGFMAPTLFNWAGGGVNSSFGGLQDCPVPPETHYWQSILGFLICASYFVLPLVGFIALFGIIGTIITSSHAKAFAANQEILIKRKAGELLFYLNQLHRRVKHENSEYKIKTMALIQELHHTLNEVGDVPTLKQLKSYVETYKTINASVI